MNLLKRITTFILALALIMQIGVPAMAANTNGVTYTATIDQPTLNVSNEDQTVTVTVNTNKAVQMDSLWAKVITPNGLKLESISNETITFGSGDYNKNTGIITWSYGYDTDEMNATTSTLAVIKFTVPANIIAGEYVIDFDIYDITADFETWEDGETVSVTLTVNEAAPSTFKLDGDVKADDVSEGDDLTDILKSAESKEGYTFKGWSFYKDAAKTQPVALDGNKMPAYDLYVFGNWAKLYTLTFYDENGNKIANAGGQFAEGDAISAPNYAPEGFLGWGGEGDQGVLTVPATMPGRDLSFWAKIAAKTYSVVFYDENGTTQLFTIPEIEEGETPDYEGRTPTKAADATNHYAFVGWASQKGGQVTGTSPVDGTNLTYYAVYTGTAHTDAQGNDHKCDTCSFVVSQCADSDDKDHTCDICGGAVEGEVCYGGTATCSAKAICEECGQPYGELNETAHAYATNPSGYVSNNDGTHSDKYVCANNSAHYKAGEESVDCDFDYYEEDWTAHTGYAECNVCGFQCVTHKNENPEEDHTCDICGIVATFCSEVAVHKEAVPVGCHTNGREEYWYCAVCDVYYRYEDCTQITNIKRLTIPAANTVVKVPAKEATCTVDGNLEYWYCDGCKKVWADEELTKLSSLEAMKIGAPGHTHDHYVTTDTTHQSICFCGEAAGEAVDHVDGEVLFAGNCQGNAWYKCTVCEANSKGDVNPTVHSTPSTNYANITDTTHDVVHACCKELIRTEAHNKEHYAFEGNCIVKAHYECSCDKEYDGELNPAVHTAGDTICYKDTEGDTHTAYHPCCDTVIETVKHTWNEGVVNPASTCLGEGTKTFTCTVCGGTSTEAVAAKGHNFGETVTAKAATCEAAGNDAYKQCTACNLYFAADAAGDSTEGKADTTSFVIAQKTHSYTGAVKSDGNGKDATHSFQCVNGCNQYGGAVKHTWNDGVVNPDSTCLGTGTKTFTCTAEGCGGTSTEAVAAKGHNFGETVTAKAATCLAGGNDAYKQCTVCNLYFAADAAGDSTEGKADTTSFVIAQKTHSYTGAVKMDSNGQDGKHSFKCVNGCENYGGAVAHTWNEGVVNPDSTCLGTGTKTFTCTAEGCGATYTEAVAAKGHNFGETVTAKAATCLAGGNDAYKQCTVCKLYFAGDAANDSTEGKADNTAFITAKDSSNHVNKAKYTNNLNGTHSAVYECCNTPGVQNEKHNYSGGWNVCRSCGQEQIKVRAHGPGFDMKWENNGLEIYKNGQLVDVLTLTGNDTDDVYVADYYETDTYEIRWNKGNDHEFHEASYVIATVGDSKTNGDITLFRYGGDKEMSALADGQRLYPECSGHDYSKYVDNGDGTHTLKCGECNAIQKTENHTYDETAHKCVCGLVETFPMHFYLNEGDETPVATLQVPFGTALQTVSYEATDELKALAEEASKSLTTTPTKDHYTYVGWLIDGVATTTMPAGPVAIYAFWKPVEYTITYDLNGGQFKDSVWRYDASAIYGEWFYLNAKNEPDVFPVEREGYTFTHFLDQKGAKYEPECNGFTGETREWFVGAMPGYDLTLTAQWQINQYTITFQNTGDREYAPITMNYGEDIVPIANPEKPGYKFVGWTDENGNSVSIPATMPGKNMTLTAQWECLHANPKAEYENTSLHAIVCSCGTVIRTEAHSANEDGYCACGAWAYVEDFNGGKHIDHASADHLQLFFDDKFEMMWDQEIMKEIIVREGYVFDGYAYDAEGTELVENGAVFDEPTTIYVMWEPVLYTLTIKTNIPTEIGNDYISMSVEEHYETADEMFEALNHENVTGYHFTGYTYENGSEVKFPFRYPATDLTLIEQYVANEYTLTIDLGEHGTFADGTTKAEVKAAYGVKPEYPAFTANDGYKLTGWIANFGGEDQAATELPTEMRPADGTYTAKWELIDVAVNFKDGDVTETVSGKYFDEKSAPTPAAKEGHTFLGWYEHAGENAEKVFDAGQTITLNSVVKDKTYYAKWEANTYNIHWNLNGGVVVDGHKLIETAKYGDQISVMLAVEKTGWVLSQTNGVTAEGVDGSYFYTTPYCQYDFTMPANDITLTLNWDVWYVGIEWLVEGESTMDTVAYGNVPVYPNGIPTKASDEQYTYTFAGWSPEVVPATGPAEYTATFTPVLRSYDITFMVDGTETKVSTKYGETPVYDADGKVPTKESDEKYSYTFAGWDTDLVPVTGEATYTATWTETPVEHTVTFLVEGQIWKQYAGGYGTAVDYSDLETPSKTGHSFAWNRAEAEWPATIPAENVTITGTYTPNQYTITFMDGENEVDKITKNYGDAITAPTPTKEGYTLTGWKDAEGNAFAYTNMPADDVTVYACWSTIDYDITVVDSITEQNLLVVEDFILYGIEAENAEYLNYYIFDVPMRESILVRDGYVFVDYTWDKEGTDSIFPYVQPANDVTFYAQYQPIDYTITFMNGDTKVGEITAAYNSDITKAVAAISVTAPEGHSFNCWMNDSGKCVTLDTMPLNGMTVYADFAADEFNINFFATEGDETAFETFKVPFGTKLDKTSDDPATDEDETDAGKLAELLAQMTEPTKEGHTWKGWDTENVPGTMPAEAVNIYGKWDVNSYTVTADGEDYTFAYGETVTIPVPTKEGHTFGGWNETVPTTMPAHDVVLTAKWTVNTYSITFDVEGIETITANFGEEIIKPADPELAGHTFQGWSVDGETVIDFPATMPENGLNLKAVWARNTIYITFNVEGNEKTVEFKYGDPITVPEDLKLEKAADNKWTYKFTNWEPALPETAEVGATYTALFEEDQKITYNVKFQDPDNAEYGFETKLAWDAVIDLTTLEGFTAPKKDHNALTWTVDGAEVKFPYTMEAKDVTFVAKWTPEIYTITIDGAEPVSYAYGADLKIPAPTKEGHEFKGWLKNGEAYEIPATMPAENLVLTSDWKVNSYKLTFKYASAENQEETVVFEAVDYGAALADKIPTVPSWTDSTGLTYEFLSWSAEVPATMPATDLEVSATFTKTGWFTDGKGTTYLVQDTPIAYSDWEVIQEAKYWFDAEGYIVKDITLIDGNYYAFDHENGKFLADYTGIYKAVNGDLYYVENGVAVENKGLFRDMFVQEDNQIHIHYYYFGCGANGCTDEACVGAGQYKAQMNTRHWVEHTNGHLMKGGYTFGADGVIEHTEDTNRSGIQTIDGVKFYLMDGVKVPKGLFLDHGYYYYARSSGNLAVNITYWVSANKTNGLDLKAGNYKFDEEGRIVFETVEVKHGFYEENGAWYYYENGSLCYKGLYYFDGTNGEFGEDWQPGPTANDPGYYYVNSKCQLVLDKDYWISKNNGHMQNKTYHFDENGTMTNPETEKKNGFYWENGAWYYYEENVKTYAGLIWCDGPEGNDPGYYYVNSSCRLVTGCSYWISKNNGYMKNMTYTFSENGKMEIDAEKPSKPEEPKLPGEELAGHPLAEHIRIAEDGTWYYYKDGAKTYAGLILAEDDNYYYVNSSGKIIRNETYWISKNNGYMKNRSYTFDANGVMTDPLPIA